MPALAGGACLVLASRWLRPERRSALQQGRDTREDVVERLVEPGGGVEGRNIGEARLRQLEGSFLIELVRDETVRVAVSPPETLRGVDRLVFGGATNAIRELRRIDRKRGR